MIDAIFFLLIGAFAGLLSGLFGIGGGIVVVPLLASMFDHHGFPHSMVMHFASGTSLAVMIITTSSSMRAHIKLGNSVWPILRSLFPGLFIGIITGALIADSLHSNVLRIIFGVLLLLIAMKTFFAREIRASKQLPTPFLMSVLGFGVGTLSGLLGMGGGAILVPLLMYLSVDIRLAVAVSTACGLVSALVGTSMYMMTGANEIYSMHWTTGYIYWPAFIGVAIATPIFSTIGARLSNRLPVPMLRRLFAFFMLIAGIKLLVY